ncbi:MAG: hypothetical protein PHY54_18190 [Methylococcales bacterium]|nr:hypothetical protein [Methylococcales bacterium]
MKIRYAYRSTPKPKWICVIPHVVAHHHCRKAVKADDHDMGLKDKLAPFGILNMMTGLLTVIFGISFETSDFIVDCLEQWWDDNKELYRHIKQLVINLDNGPQNSSHRTQFMKRMIELQNCQWING